MPQPVSFASRTNAFEQPDEVAAVIAAIKADLQDPDGHLHKESHLRRVHPEAWPHIAAAALDASFFLDEPQRDTVVGSAIMKRLTWPSMHWRAENIGADECTRIARVVLQAVAVLKSGPVPSAESINAAAEAMYETDRESEGHQYPWNVAEDAVRDRYLALARAAATHLTA